MCLQTSSVIPYQRWRWAGDDIVQNPIVASTRSIGGRTRPCETDVRGFLAEPGNAVLRREIDALIEGLAEADRRRFLHGTYDERIQCVLSYLRGLKFIPGGRGADQWQQPEETIARGGGDCEDLAFLLASMAEAAGVSSYCLRVALGSVWERKKERARRCDHAWVVYLNERGAWQILEPAAYVGSARRSSSATRGAARLTYEYVPHYVFNRQHLWRVRCGDLRAAGKVEQYVKDRGFWKHFDPKFAQSVHNSIFDEALQGMSWLQLGVVKTVSLGLDADVLAYDPRDHFDFAYVDEGWRKIHQRLKSGGIVDFAMAVHSIGDFYGHTTYADFGRRKGQALLPYDPREGLSTPPTYDFEAYGPLPGCNVDPATAARGWKGKIISGQWWRSYVTYPKYLKRDSGKWCRLPDHDLVAVDRPARPASHKRYDEAEFAIQFADRRAAAVAHIRKVYQEWKARRAD